MRTFERVTFDVAGISALLRAAVPEQLDQLDFGVIEMDLGARVLRYNRTESRHSGLPPHHVIGRNFFTQVGPCTNNPRVAARFTQPTLDETISYTFALLGRSVPVTLRLVKEPGERVMYLLVRWA